MNNYSKLSKDMILKFNNANTLLEKQRIINRFVDKLRISGFNKKEIEKICNIDHLTLAQSSKQMIENNKLYKKALEKALGRKTKIIRKTSDRKTGNKE